MEKIYTLIERLGQNTMPKKLSFSVPVRAATIMNAVILTLPFMVCRNKTARCSGQILMTSPHC